MFGYACDRCREKHQSCDHDIPCRRCIKAGVPEFCHYTPKRSRSKTISSQTNHISACAFLDSNLRSSHLLFQSPQSSPNQQLSYGSDTSLLNDKRNPPTFKRSWSFPPSIEHSPIKSSNPLEYCHNSHYFDHQSNIQYHQRHQNDGYTKHNPNKRSLPENRSPHPIYSQMEVPPFLYQMVDPLSGKIFLSPFPPTSPLFIPKEWVNYSQTNKYSYSSGHHQPTSTHSLFHNSSCPTSGFFDKDYCPLASYSHSHNISNSLLPNSSVVPSPSQPLLNCLSFAISQEYASVLGHTKEVEYAKAFNDATMSKNQAKAIVNAEALITFSSSPSLFQQNYEKGSEFSGNGFSKSILATGMLVQEFLRDSFNLLKETSISTNIEPQSDNIVEDTESESENDDTSIAKKLKEFKRSSDPNWSVSGTFVPQAVLDIDPTLIIDDSSNFSCDSHPIRSQLIEEPILSGI